MYTLYYSPGSCSLVINCLMEELGLAFETRKVEVEAKERPAVARAMEREGIQPFGT